MFVAPDEEERQEAHAENLRHDMEQALKRMEENQAIMLREMAALRRALKDAQADDDDEPQTP